jgi:lauroyl/myristoyl acyltransferase
MTAVAEVLEPPELFEWFVGIRKKMGLTIVPMGEQSGGVILRTLRENKLVGLLCDRDITANGVPVQFFGAPTTMPGGPATLALRTGAPILPTVVYSGPGPMHTAVIAPPIDLTRTKSLRADVHRVTQDIATCFEHFIARAPEQWHMFQRIWEPGTSTPAASAAS